jgi:hypothetical protein
MTKTILCILALGLSFTTTHADTFGSGSNAFTIDFVTIGNPGNADDAEVGAGAVSYIDSIGVTEVPADWITKATNLGLANVSAGPWMGLQPASDLTWYEAAPFVNSDLTIPVASATALTTAYWKGGLSGAPSTWAASNGSTQSNRATGWRP